MSVMNNKMAMYNWRNDLQHNIVILLSPYESQMPFNCFLKSFKISSYHCAINVY